MTESSVRWERYVPVYNVPVVTGAFVTLVALAAVAVGLTGYRELAGLGPVTGMNDAYAWGIWKTVNTMVLTGLGSGAFAVGIAAWLFKRHRLHTVMRTALLTSFLAYLSGLILLGIDVGRPWNMFWLLFPWKWNFHSPLLEVAFCMPVYAMIPLGLENVPPVLEWVYEHRPNMRPRVDKLTKLIQKYYAYVVAAAYVLPAMHQSSLGSLMLLAGDRVHRLWQTPYLPLLYVWAAAYMGFACVAGTLLFTSIIWRRPIDLEVLNEMAKITGRLVATWMIFRFFDLTLQDNIKAAFAFDRFAGLFWVETLVLVAGGSILWISAKSGDAKLMFLGHLLVAIGGSLYRFNPTTLAFQPRPGAFYFPAAMEILISGGFVALVIAIFMLAAKVMAILPAPRSAWYDMEAKLGKVARYSSAPGAVAHTAGRG
jgi:Ni/Fe-hydrogenase subunit HybB-like protein